MSKYTTATIIQLEFLNIEEGKEILLTVPDNSSVAYTIRNFLHQHTGHVLTDIHIDHEFRKDE